MAQIDKHDITNDAECKHCFHECHCDETLHISSDELDAGGPCVCEECKHEI